MGTIHHYTVSFDEIKINRERIIKAIGYPQNKVPVEIIRLIDTTVAESKEYCNIEGGYYLTNDIAIDLDRSELLIEKVVLTPEKIIVNQIKKSSAIAVFLCTVGPDMENRAKKMYKSGDSLLAYIIDSIASETVEVAMDIIQDRLAIQMKQKKMNITNRFSPGYCSWQVSEQQKLFSLLPPEFCGVTLNPSSLMIPIKSISGIIGIGKEVRKKDYPCKICDERNCIKRKDS